METVASWIAGPNSEGVTESVPTKCAKEAKETLLDPGAYLDQGELNSVMGLKCISLVCI